MRHLRSLTFLLAAFVSFSSICLADDTGASRSKKGFITGEARQVGNGSAWTWVESGANGTPVRIGVTFTEAALSGLPTELPDTGTKDWEHPLPLPAQAAVAPFTHVTMNWNPHGHIPPGVYDVPHFDFHFYIISPTEREKITCEGEDSEKCFRKPDARYLPVDYTLPPGTEFPRMGVHWIDPTSPEFNKQPFNKTFIYGSYDGQLAFIEPMVAKNYLETKPNIEADIKLPAEYQEHGYYPGAYSINYDPALKEFTISLEDLTWR